MRSVHRISTQADVHPYAFSDAWGRWNFRLTPGYSRLYICDEDSGLTSQEVRGINDFAWRTLSASFHVAREGHDRPDGLADEARSGRSRRAEWRTGECESKGAGDPRPR